MAHGMEKRDNQYSKKMDWHKLTNVVEKLTKEVCIPYKMIPCPLYSVLPDGNNVELEKEYVRIRASDDGLPIGRPYNPSTYSLHTHSDLWNLIEGIYEKAGITPDFESCGTFKDRTRYYVSAKMPEMHAITNNKHPEYLYFNGFDGCTKEHEMTLGISTIKPVCNNTVKASISEMISAGIKAGIANNGDLRRAQLLGRLRHNKNFQLKLEEVKNIIHSLMVAYGVYRDQIQILNKIPMREDEVRATVTGFLFPIEDSVTEFKDCPLISTKSLNIIDDLTYLFKNGHGNDGLTRLDMFNGFTEKFSNRPSLLSEIGNDEGFRKLNKFIQSSHDGVFNEKKVRFFDMLCSNKETEKAYENGALILEAQDFLGKDSNEPALEVSGSELD